MASTSLFSNNSTGFSVAPEAAFVAGVCALEPRPLNDDCNPVACCGGAKSTSLLPLPDVT